MTRRTSRKTRCTSLRRTSLRRNTSLVKQGADASAMALIERAEHALSAGDYNVATIAFERLDAWKSRHGAWPFTAARYWRAVDEMQRGSQASLRRNSLRPPTWENYNEDTGVVLDRFSSRLDAVREAEDWRRSGFRVSSRKIGLRSNSRRRTSLRRNSADWSTRTAVAAKARAALARGDSRAAQRHLSELSTIDLAMMPRAVRRNGSPYSTVFHKDGSITFWSVYDQSWVRHARNLDDADWASMNPRERTRVEKHFRLRRNGRRTSRR